MGVGSNFAVSSSFMFNGRLHRIVNKKHGRSMNIFLLHVFTVYFVRRRCQYVLAAAAFDAFRVMTPHHSCSIATARNPQVIT